MKTAVLIHGYHIEAAQWSQVMWGNPPEVLGRIPRGVLRAFESNAELIFMGTGSSTKDGKVDGQWTYDTMLAHASELAELAGTDEARMRAWLTERSVVDTKMQDTVGEIRACADAANERGISSLTLVSSPTHISRCLLVALILAEEPAYAWLTRGVDVAVSDVSYPGFGPADVTVIEPPHRADLEALPVHIYARATASLIRNPRFAEFLAGWKELLERFGAKID